MSSEDVSSIACVTTALPPGVQKFFVVCGGSVATSFWQIDVLVSPQCHDQCVAEVRAVFKARAKSAFALPSFLAKLEAKVHSFLADFSGEPVVAKPSAL